MVRSATARRTKRAPAGAGGNIRPAGWERRRGPVRAGCGAAGLGETRPRRGSGSVWQASCFRKTGWADASILTASRKASKLEIRPGRINRRRPVQRRLTGILRGPSTHCPRGGDHDRWNPEGDQGVGEPRLHDPGRGGGHEGPRPHRAGGNGRRSGQRFRGRSLPEGGRRGGGHARRGLRARRHGHARQGAPAVGVRDDPGGSDRLHLPPPGGRGEAHPGPDGAEVDQHRLRDHRGRGRVPAAPHAHERGGRPDGPPAGGQVPRDDPRGPRGPAGRRPRRGPGNGGGHRGRRGGDERRQDGLRAGRQGVSAGHRPEPAAVPERRDAQQLLPAHVQPAAHSRAGDQGGCRRGGRAHSGRQGPPGW